MTTILAAAGTGVAVLLAGNLPWAALGAWNLRYGTMAPWAVVPMALYLWAYWRFLGGAWGAPASRTERRERLRANGLPAHIWVASMAAGLLGFASLVALLALAARLVSLPSSAPIAMPPEMPMVTALSLLAMQSIMAGVTEEAAFRGYMQSMVERRYGLIVAVLATGTLFGLLHFSSHPADVLMMLPYYIAVSAVYGGLTWACDSILPALVLHSAGDIVVLTRWWLTGRPEWQIGSTPPPLVWDGGVDGPFMLVAVASVVLVVLTVLAYAAVRKRRVIAFSPPRAGEQAFAAGETSHEGAHP